MDCEQAPPGSPCPDLEKVDKVEDAAIKRKSDGENDDLQNSKKIALSANEEKKAANLRKNIRDVLDENQLDSITLAAQREESERLARVNEQQKVIREYQRQTAVNRQVARTQSKVLSLLQSGNTFAKEADLSTTCYISNEEEEPAKSITDLDEENSLKEVEEVKSEPVLDDSETRDPCEVVTIEDSSDDDCILLSDEEIEEPIDDEEDDSNNSGLHVKDVYNIPDELGRVVVNIGHPEGDEDIFVAPQIARIIKPHQIGGVRFLFDNIIESTSRFKSSSGFGCILAHSMGLGKTMQVVCFCDLFMRHTDSKKILCVMPINTVQNWLSEFNMWTPRYSENEEYVRPRTFDVFVLNDHQKTLSARAKVIKQWDAEGGVLLIGYELFRLLALKLSATKRRKKGSDKNDNGITTHNKNLMEDVHKALVKPGPDLVICDEGHRIKNSHAGISVALKQMRTRRRIVLTGYPLQNNLLEYWCMVDFVRPNYLGTRTEFCNMFERPIQNGQCFDSTPGDIKLMRYRAHVLHSLLVGFVQRRSHIVLQETLPQKHEYVILTKMTKFQKELYKNFVNVTLSKPCPNPLKAFAVCCKFWNHPDVLHTFLKKRQADLDLEIDEVVSENNSSVATPEKAESNPIICPNNTKSPENGNEPEKISAETNGCQSGALNEQAKRNLFGNEYLRQYSSNENEYWKYGNTYDPCGSIQYSTTPNYVGTVKEVAAPKNGEASSNSSEIVDLDTKEIKTVSTYLDMNKPAFVENSKDSSNKSLNSPENSSNNKPESDQLKVENSSEKDEIRIKNEENGVSYDWAKELMANYIPDLIENSPKMEIVFYILKESLALGDRVLLFSQSLLTLNLIERFLEANYIPTTNIRWSKGLSYFRLDGSTSAQEREKLVNEFNANTNVKLFLISTKAGSLGINLIGANRVIIFDASWNPCHDTQAVYRVYRFGQKKACFIYRIVMDKCLEKKIYDRQIKKQGMSNRVVDECNPESHFSIKDSSNLCLNNESDLEDDGEEDFTPVNEDYGDTIVQKLVELYKNLLSKEPFHHESLLVERNEKKLSQAEKRLAHRGYEAEKKSIIQKSSYNNVQYRMVRSDGTFITKPTASIRPIQSTTKNTYRSTRWIPAEVWQRQGMTAQEMTLPLDVVIPTNSSDKTNIILKAGQRVMVLKSTKGIYMQLESGKIIAIRTAAKPTEASASGELKIDKNEVIDITDNDTDGNVESKTSNTNENNNAKENLETPSTGDSETFAKTEKDEKVLQNANADSNNMQNMKKDANDFEEPLNWNQKQNVSNKPLDAWNTTPKCPPYQNLVSNDSSQQIPMESSSAKEFWHNSSQNSTSKPFPHNQDSHSTNNYNDSEKTSTQMKHVGENLQNHNQKDFSQMDVTQNNKSMETNSANMEVRQGGECSKSKSGVSTQNSSSLTPFNNKETKNSDYSYFNKQHPQNFFKPSLYPPIHNTHQHPYSSSQSTMTNCVPSLTNHNNSNSYLPESGFSNYPMNFYDNYNPNAFMETGVNQSHRPYMNYVNYNSYPSSYQPNYSNHSASQNASLPAPTSSTSSTYKTYPWPNINPPAANYPSATNYNAGSDANRWPH